MKNPRFVSVAPGRTLLTAAIAALLVTHAAQAANKAWSTAPPTANFSGTNWTASNTPGAAATTVATLDTLYFGASAVNTVNNDLTGFVAAGITFNAGAAAFTITGNAITLGVAAVVAPLPPVAGVASDVTNNSTSLQTFNVDLALPANRNFTTNAGGGNIVLSGVISGAGRLQGSGTGTLIVNGATANTFTGGISAANNATTVIDLSNIASHTNLVAAGNQPNLGNGNGAAFGTLIIRGANTGTSAQTLNGISLATGTAGSIIVDSNSGGGTNLALGTASTNGTRSTGSTVVFDISSAGSTLNGTTLGLTAGTQNLTQAVSKFALVKDATGTGFAVNVGGGLVRYTGGTALAPSGNAANGNFTLAAGGTTTTLTASANIGSLNITTTGAAGVLDIGAGNTLGATSPAAQTPILTQGNAAVTIQNGQLGSSGNEVVLHAIGTGGVTISSTIGGTNTAFTKSGSDTVTLTGSNSYTGVTAVVQGILKSGSTTAFSSASTFNIANSAGVGVDISAANSSIGSLQGGGTLGGGIVLGASTLTVGAKNFATVANETTYNGVISGSGGLNKVGTGPQVLGGANTYTGATTITGGGTLTLAGSGSINNTSGVFVGTGSTYNVTAKGSYSANNLSGEGTVTGNFTVSTQLATGAIAGATGGMTFTNNLTLAATSTHVVDVNGGTAAADFASVGGNLAFAAGTKLDLVQLGTYTVGDKYTLFSYTGTVSGVYLGLANGSTFTDANGQWVINYNDTAPGTNGGIGGKYVTITAVPEPSALLLGGLTLLGLAARRTRRAI